MAKGLAAGNPSGVAVVAEGVAELIDPADFAMLETVATDEHGHIRLADLPFGKLLADALKEKFSSRGVAVALGSKDVGYELRCVSPCAFDRDYTRALGAGAVNALLGGTSGALITRQESRIVPIPFADLMDPATGRTRVRMVEIDTDVFRQALALQTRVTAADLEDDEKLAAIAAAAGLSAAEARERYAPLG